MLASVQVVCSINCVDHPSICIPGSSLSKQQNMSAALEASLCAVAAVVAAYMSTATCMAPSSCYRSYCEGERANGTFGWGLSGPIIMQWQQQLPWKESNFFLFFLFFPVSFSFVLPPTTTTTPMAIFGGYLAFCWGAGPLLPTLLSTRPAHWIFALTVFILIHGRWVPKPYSFCSE